MRTIDWYLRPWQVINNGGRETDYGILAIVVDFFFGCASRKKTMDTYLPSCTRAQPIIGSI
jgi:hypothetical protein